MAEVELSIGVPYSTEHPAPGLLEGASKVITKSGGKITLVEYYRSYDSDTDQPILKFCKEDYEYSGNKLTQVNVTWYKSDGSVDRTEIIKYQTDESNSNISREIRTK